jgi:hypothetical protein
MKVPLYSIQACTAEDDAEANDSETPEFLWCMTFIFCMVLAAFSISGEVVRRS